MTSESAAMSDLRTRIAKAVYALIQAPVKPFDEQPDHIKDMWFEEADAVIRELGLTVEWDGDDPYNPGPRSSLHRYVTEWIDDDH